MHTICPRCGAELRLGRAPGNCEHCHEHTSRDTAGEDDSGLIDIGALPGMLGRPISDVRPLRGALHDSPPPPRRRRPASQSHLHLLLGVLAFTAVGLAGAVVHSASQVPPHTTVRLVAAPPPMAPSPALDELDADMGPEAAATDEDEDEIELVDDIVLLDEDEVEAPAPRKSRATTRQRRRPAAPAPAPEPELAAAPVVPAAPPVVARPTDDSASVACLLHPEDCVASRPAPVTRSPAPKADAGLPARLELADITSGTHAARASAMRSCASLARGGERLKIRLSIAGPTGEVLESRARVDGGNPALASCCARELAAAQFKPVQKAQFGTVVTLNF